MASRTAPPPVSIACTVSSSVPSIPAGRANGAAASAGAGLAGGAGGAAPGFAAGAAAPVHDATAMRLTVSATSARGRPSSATLIPPWARISPSARSRSSIATDLAEPLTAPERSSLPASAGGRDVPGATASTSLARSAASPSMRPWNFGSVIASVSVPLSASLPSASPRPARSATGVGPAPASAPRLASMLSGRPRAVSVPLARNGPDSEPAESWASIFSIRSSVPAARSR